MNIGWKWDWGLWNMEKDGRMGGGVRKPVASIMAA